jgi:hypothetical protein
MDRGWDRLELLIQRVSAWIEDVEAKLVDARAELLAFDEAGNASLVEDLDAAMLAYSEKVKENCTPEGLEIDPVKDELNELQLAWWDLENISARLYQRNRDLTRRLEEKEKFQAEMDAAEDAESEAASAKDSAEDEKNDAYEAYFQCLAVANINGLDAEIECRDVYIDYLLSIDVYDAANAAYQSARESADIARNEMRMLDDTITALEDGVDGLTIAIAPIQERFDKAMDAYNKALTTQLLIMRKCEPSMFVAEEVAIEKAIAALSAWRTERLILDNAVKLLTSQWTSAKTRLFYLQNVTSEMTIVRDAWCTDYTTDLEIGDEVATCEVPNEPQNVIIAAGGRAQEERDGKLLHRYVHTPEQLFFNVATLPGWQKWKPMYRVGTITSISYEDDTASVDLDEARSSATGKGSDGSPTTGNDWGGPPGDDKGLPVNQDMPLDQIPVVYMECNADAFEVGDRVLVEFVDQEWEGARVIGFESHPVECPWTGAFLQVPFYRFGTVYVSVNCPDEVNVPYGRLGTTLIHEYDFYTGVPGSSEKIKVYSHKPPEIENDDACPRQTITVESKNWQSGHRYRRANWSSFYMEETIVTQEPYKAPVTTSTAVGEVAFFLGSARQYKLLAMGEPGIIEHAGGEYKLWAVSAYSTGQANWINSHSQYVQMGWAYWRRRS